MITVPNSKRLRMALAVITLAIAQSIPGVKDFLAPLLDAKILGSLTLSIIISLAALSAVYLIWSDKLFTKGNMMPRRF